jgi:hypothetical protein
LLDARVLLGDSSAFDVSSLFLHSQEKIRGSDIWGSSISARAQSPSPSPTPSPLPSFFTTKKGTESTAAVLVELELPFLPSHLNIGCHGLKHELGESQVDVKPTCMRMQFFPLLAAATGCSWRVTVLGVTGAL